MNPNDRSQGGDALGPAVPQPSQTPPPQDHQAAAANLLRTQINALYGDRPVAAPPERPVSVEPREAGLQSVQSAPRTVSQSQELQQTNPYERSHTDHPQPQAEQWKAYHSAWQDYYQKYYSAYYGQQAAAKQAELEQQHQAAQAQPTQDTSANQADGFFQNQHEEPAAAKDSTDITKDEALFELRQKLLGKVRTQATKIRRSRHFVPIVAALTIVLVFVFLQYNQVLIATVNAYVSPGAIDPQNIVVDPSADNNVSSDPRLVIPKINVDVPALYDVGSDYDSQMAAMQKGVAHFAIPGANSHPGEIGNTVLSGHSSNDLFDPGDYKFIFAQLDKLTTGDTIYANYQGKRYTYVVTKKEVVAPTDVAALVYPTNKPIMTLITCTPLGTSQNRLLVTAEQVSPDPASANAAPAGSGQTGSGEATSIPGASSPTIIERIFGAH